MSEKAKYIRFLSYLKATHDRLQGWKQDCATLNPVIDTGDIEKLLKSLSRHGKSDQRENLQLPVDCLNEIFSYLPYPVAAVAPDANHDGTAVLKVMQTCGLCLFLVCENPSLKNREEAQKGEMPKAWSMVMHDKEVSEIMAYNVPLFCLKIMEEYNGVDGVLKIFGTHPTDGLTSERAKLLKRVFRSELQKTAKGLKKYTTTVIRDGKRTVIPSNRVVPGDLLFLGGDAQYRFVSDCRKEQEASAHTNKHSLFAELCSRRCGGYVPYNCLLTSGTITMDNSSITGESYPVTVTALDASYDKLNYDYVGKGDPFVFGGTHAAPVEASVEATAVVSSLFNPIALYTQSSDAFSFDDALHELNLASTSRILAGALDELAPAFDSD